MEGILKILTALQSIMFQVIFKLPFIFIFLIYYLLNLSGNEVFNLIVFDFAISYLKTAVSLFGKEMKVTIIIYTSDCPQWKYKESHNTEVSREDGTPKRNVSVWLRPQLVFPVCPHQASLVAFLSMSSHREVVFNSHHSIWQQFLDSFYI